MGFLFVVNIVSLLFSLFVIGVVLGVLFSKPFRVSVVEFVRRTFRSDLLLARVSSNPVIRPGKYPWEAEAVLNPAAVVIGERTYLLYRAIGSDGVSRLGYASSGNSIVFDERLPYPAYTAQNPRDVPQHFQRYSAVLYPSGGSWGGCEDPRMVTIEGRVYVIYNAFDGWDFIRVAFISISEQDFINKHFYKWSIPRLLSRSGQRHKNWVLFPEKIGGKFAILHNLYGDDADHVRIVFIENLDTFDPAQDGFESPDPLSMPPRHIAWHYRMRSAGPPPVKTRHGWLVFYHATSETEGYRYKLGAMLLEYNNPTRVLYRAEMPILTPDELYENEGKPGIVYACGAVVHNEMLYLYYGGADKVVCAAFAPLEPFLQALMAEKNIALKTVPLQTA